MSDAYVVEQDDAGCSLCIHGRSYNIVGPDGVALGRSWEDADEVAQLADLLNTAFNKGRQSAAASVDGWRLVKDSTFDMRSWREDESHENGNYHNVCMDCGRTFQGHKRRPLCKVCTDQPSRSPSATASAPSATRPTFKVESGEDRDIKLWIGGTSRVVKPGESLFIGLADYVGVEELAPADSGLPKA